MNPVRPSSEIHRIRLLISLTVPAALFIALGCGNGDDDDPPPSNKWDEMKWDEGKWGATPAPFDAPRIA